jgi:hypothetical protein
MDTPEFEQSSDERNHRFERMRLRGLSGARDEFHLARRLNVSCVRRRSAASM